MAVFVSLRKDKEKEAEEKKNKQSKPILEVTYLKNA